MMTKTVTTKKCYLVMMRKQILKKRIKRHKFYNLLIKNKKKTISNKIPIKNLMKVLTKNKKKIKTKRRKNIKRIKNNLLVAKVAAVVVAAVAVAQVMIVTMNKNRKRKNKRNKKRKKRTKTIKRKRMTKN